MFFTVPDLRKIMPDLRKIMPDLTWIKLDLAWVVMNLKTDMDSHPADHPNIPVGVLIVTAMHPMGSDEPGHQLKTLDRGYIKSHSTSLDDPFNPSQFQKRHLLLGSYPTPS
ncbi:hypothetical protein YC2023_030716 [Brassica napus]